MARISVTDNDGGVQAIFAIDFSGNGLSQTEAAMFAELFDGNFIINDQGLARAGLMLDIVEALEIIKERESSNA